MGDLRIEYMRGVIRINTMANGYKCCTITFSTQGFRKYFALGINNEVVINEAKSFIFDLHDWKT